MGDELKTIIKNIKTELDDNFVIIQTKLDTHHKTPPSHQLLSLPLHNDLGLDNYDENMKDNHDHDDSETEDNPPKKNVNVQNLVTTERSLSNNEKKKKSKTKTKTKTKNGRISKTKITKKEFETEKALFLEKVPDCVKQQYREVGFAKWKGAWLPVIIVGPYDVVGPLRNEYKNMFEKARKNGKNPTNLVYWLGTPKDEFDNAFSFVAKFVSYQEGVKNNYLTRIPKNQKEAVLLGRGLHELEIERHLPKEDRIKSIPGFSFYEEYETDSDIDNKDGDTDKSKHLKEASKKEKSYSKKRKKSKSSTIPDNKSPKKGLVELDTDGNQQNNKRLKGIADYVPKVDNESDSENEYVTEVVEQEIPASKTKKAIQSSTEPTEERSLEDGDDIAQDKINSIQMEFLDSQQTSTNLNHSILSLKEMNPSTIILRNDHEETSATLHAKLKEVEVQRDEYKQKYMIETQLLQDARIKIATLMAELVSSKKEVEKYKVQRKKLQKSLLNLVELAMEDDNIDVLEEEEEEPPPPSPLSCLTLEI